MSIQSRSDVEAISLVEAMKQALEALEYIDNNYMSLPKVGNEAITSLRIAIEQAEKQEPVAIALNTGTKQGVKWLKNVEHGEKLYTTPQAAQEELQRLSALVRAQQITIEKLEASTEKAHDEQIP
jgi:hypothetical protein